MSEESERPAPPEYTAEQVAAHNTRNDLWLVIEGLVYQVPVKFVGEHPGGEDVLLEHAGKDATSAFAAVGHSADAIKQLNSFEIGKLAGYSATPKPKKSAPEYSGDGPGVVVVARPPGPSPFMRALPVLIIAIAIAIALRYLAFK